MRALAILAALVLFGVAVTTAPVRPVVTGAVGGVVLAVVAAIALRRWLATAAACAFVAAYALALWLAGGAVDLRGATAFGIALLGLLQPLEVARGRRGATDVGVLRSQLVGWGVFGLAVPALVILAFGLGRVVASSVPPLAAPLLAAAGAIGVVLGLAAALTRGERAK